MSVSVAIPTIEECLQFLHANSAEMHSAWRPFADGAALERLAETNARRLLLNSRASSIVVHQGGELAGVACWSSLPWDTEMFGFPAGRLDLLASRNTDQSSVDIKNDLVAQVIDECKSAGIQHLIARVNASDTASIHALEGQGFQMIDGIQSFVRRLSSDVRTVGGSTVSEAVEIRQYREDDLDQILAIARSSYVVDRFHADSTLSTDTADRVNEQWLRNSCLGTMADAVIVAAKGNDVLAYVTCKIDHEASSILGMGCGVIGMVATAPSARRTGAASAATLGALEWFQTHDVSVVEVGTQLRNIPAARLYEQSGFRLAAVSFTFRKWMGSSSR